MKERPVYPLVAPWILLSLITGLIGGLVRIGWNIPAIDLAGLHGLLMVGGFLGTVISFEKTVPLNNRTWLLIPMISGISVLAMVTGLYKMALILQLVASFGLVVTFFKWLSKTKEHYYRIMIIGSLSWLIAISGLLAGRTIPSILPWWIAFILFIIVGERLELTKFLPTSKKIRSLLYLALIIYLIGVFIPYNEMGRYIIGASVAAVGLWLVRFDIVRVSIKKKGRYRYIAINLLLGYLWLFVVGIITALLPIGGYSYDAMVHSFFLGFAFSMIFAHGPIIIPGIIKRNYDLFSKSLYIWVAGFQTSMLVRIGGDIIEVEALRLYGGLANAIFIVGFLVNMIINVRRASYRKSVSLNTN